MKHGLMLSVEEKLLAEARGAGWERGTFSNLFEEALRTKLAKGLTVEEIAYEKEGQLSKIKIMVNQKAALFPERFKKCVRFLKYCGVASTTIDERIAFWSRVLEEMKKEIPPEPPKERVV